MSSTGICDPNPLYILAGETRLVSVDMRGLLDEGETFTGTPTITVSPSGPTLSNKVVSTAALTIRGEIVAVGKAIQCLVSGQTAGVDYQLLIACGTTSTPAQTVKASVKLSCIAETA